MRRQTPFQLRCFRQTVITAVTVVLWCQGLFMVLVYIDSLLHQKAFQDVALLTGGLGVMLLGTAFLLVYSRSLFYRADCLNCGTVNRLNKHECCRCKKPLLEVAAHPGRAAAMITVSSIAAVAHFIVVFNWGVRWLMVVTAGITVEFFRYISLEGVMLLLQLVSVGVLVLLPWRLLRLVPKPGEQLRRVPAAVVLGLILVVLVYGVRLLSPVARQQVRAAALYNLELRSTGAIQKYVTLLRGKIIEDINSEKRIAQ